MIDINKLLTTEGGHAVREVRRMEKPVGDYVFIGIVEPPSGSEFPALWTESGYPDRISEEYTLTNELVLWVNIIQEPEGKLVTHSYTSKECALAAWRAGEEDFITYAFPVQVPLGWENCP